MVALVKPSKAMEPHVRVIEGFQAVCNEDGCAQDPTGIWAEGWYRWWGNFEEKWIMAQIEAKGHNMEHHGELG